MNKAMARMRGRVTIDRTWFGIGQGEWSDTEVVGYKVTVVVNLTLSRSG